MADNNETEIVKRAYENAGNWYQYFSKNNKKYKDHIAFVRGRQWDKNAETAQRNLGKPVMTLNKLYPSVKQVVGEFRSFVPDYKLRDERLAGQLLQQDALDILSDLMRSISYESNAPEIYSTSAQNALMGGYGAFGVYAERDRLNPFLKTLKYKIIPDSTAAFFDPMAERKTKTDGNYSGLLSGIEKKVFKEIYGIDPPAPTEVTFCESSWLKTNVVEQVIIMDYYERSFVDTEYALLSNNDVIKMDDWQDAQKEYKEKNQKLDNQLPVLKILEKKTIKTPIIMVYKIAGDKFLEKPVRWFGTRLPLVFCDGDSEINNGEQNTTTFTEFVHDAQQYLNYIKSDMAWSIQTLRREIFLVAPSHSAGFEKVWEHPERVQGKLPFNPDPLAPTPVRLPLPEIPQSLLQQYQSTQFDIREGLGMFEASRGQAGNEISGVAKAKEIMQSDLSNSIYFDNMKDAIREGAQIVAEALPRFYSDQQKAQIRTKNGKSKIFTFNDEMTGEDQTSVMLKGAVLNVEITAASPFREQKQQEIQNLLSLVAASAANPPIFNMMADLIAKYTDSMLRDTLVDRFKTLVPPQLLTAEGQQVPPQPPNPQAAMEQQMLQQRMQLEERKVAADEKKAEADMINAQSNVLKARASAGDVIGKHASTAQKTTVELQKAELEKEQEAMRLGAEILKQRSGQKE